VRAATGSWRTPPPPAAVMNAAITTSEVRSHEGDAQPWMMVDVARTDAEARLSAQWALKASAFRTLEQAETTRREHFSGWSAAQASTLAALQKQAAKGRGEQADCLSFLQQRAAADLAYAASFSKHRLGGKKVSELADLRAAALPGGAGSGCAPLCDAGGCSELAAVMSVLGCMLHHAAEKLTRFGESGGLAKELSASLEAYGAASDAACKAFNSDVVEAAARLDAACADAFAAHRTAWHQAQQNASAAAAGADGGKDLWLTEFHYRAAVAAFSRRLWAAARGVRQILERFRAAEHARVATLHGSLRVFVSLQQRLWADVAASTTAVHALFKELPASTGLAEDPKAIALEALLSPGSGHDEYASQPALPPSALVLHEGSLLYQRAVLRTWASAHAVLTRDGFVHLFGGSSPSSAGPSSPAAAEDLRPDHLLYSVRLAPGAAPSLRCGKTHTIEVASLVSGLLGRVGGAGVDGRSLQRDVTRSAAGVARWDG